MENEKKLETGKNELYINNRKKGNALCYQIKAISLNFANYTFSNST